MTPQIAPAIMLVPILMGCASVPADNKAELIKSALVELERQCGITAGTLRLGRDNLVSFRPSTDVKFEKVECVMRGLMKPEFADHVKIGFVSGEAPAQEEKE